MKKVIAALLAGVVLGSTGLTSAAPTDTWVRNGVFCTTLNTKLQRGVVCGLRGGKLVVINKNQIIVGTRNDVVLYTTSSR